MLLVCCCLGLVFAAGAQANQADYYTYRTKITVPPYGLEKIRALTGGLRGATMGGVASALSPKAYQSLSLREQFTYNMIHAESFTQNCSAIPMTPEDAVKIFAHLPDAFGEGRWSQRQEGFLTANRDTVLALIRESVTRSRRMGINYKHAIVIVNGKELIPFIVDLYRADRKDHDLLTVLLLLMEEGKYPPFMMSPTARKLYGPEADYDAALQLNKPNEELIMSRAMDYYHGKR